MSISEDYLRYLVIKSIDNIDRLDLIKSLFGYNLMIKQSIKPVTIESQVEFNNLLETKKSKSTFQP